MPAVRHQAQAYPWVRLRWSTLAVLALLSAVVIALVATNGLAARIGVVLIAWPALAALDLARSITARC